MSHPSPALPVETEPTVLADSDTLVAQVAKLAHARAAVADTQSELVTMEQENPVITRYLRLKERQKTEKDACRKSYGETVSAALAAYDGENQAVHPDVDIATFKTTHVHNHAAALFWVLSNAADTVDCIDTKRMTSAIQTMGKVAPLVMRRSQATALIDELFTQSVYIVEGVIEKWNPETDDLLSTVPFQKQFPDATSPADARRLADEAVQVEANATATLYRWSWQQEPQIKTLDLPVKAITFSEPGETLKPRIAQDLSHLVTASPSPLLAHLQENLS